MLAGVICLQLPFTPAQQFPRKIRETKTWIKVHTFNVQDTGGASALNRYLPKVLPGGSPAPPIAPSAGSKLQFVVSNLPSVLDGAIPPYKCICHILNATGADMHPKLVNGKQHMCTTLTRYQKYLASCVKCPSYRQGFAQIKKNTGLSRRWMKHAKHG